ncbi:hypothetical protein [Bacillus sp. S/N-304-OC-R1]|uniref:hypothetical protein n=1 Tax=Bacillus sp. S/N-304-OC-R1 TaxID=2758034 RepID=UPI001C8E8AB0|nr:hypothetical protein [Bacillus sp. S/N-304-OC-R1]MBY0122199.1 hypothetical protein [Bacillus sp. S/N-304-OC-R1]
MPQQRLYYEYVEKQLVPYWYVLTFSPFELNWDKHIHYYDALKPFEYTGRDEFDESIISMPIYLSDLVFNNDLPGKIGIHLSTIRKRIESIGVDPCLIRQLVLPHPELDEFINILPKELKLNTLIFN